MIKYTALPALLLLLFCSCSLSYSNLANDLLSPGDQIDIWNSYTETEALLVDDDSEKKLATSTMAAFSILLFIVPVTKSLLIQLLRRAIFLTPVFYQSSYLVVYPLNKE